MKKILALVLATMMAFAVIACTGSGSTTTTTTTTTTTQTEPTKTDTTSTEPAAEAKSYQLVGNYEERGGQGASMMTGAFLLNLNADGTAVCDRYLYLQYDHSDFASNPSYESGFMTGTWKAVTKDGVDCLQIKIAVVNDDGTTSNDQTAYAYEIAGEYSFDLTFPIVKGMSYSRNVTMTGGEEKKFADGNALIAAYKEDPEMPEGIVVFTDETLGANLYFLENGTVELYVGYDKVVDGTWSDEGVTLGGEDVEIQASADGSALIEYSRDRGDGVMTDYKLSCADISPLQAAAPAEAEAPAENAPYTGAPINLGGFDLTPTLTLNADGTADFSCGLAMKLKYEKVGDAVVLSVDEANPIEGQAEGLFLSVPHAWLLDEETKTMTGIKGAWTDGLKAFYAIDEATMTVALPAYGMSAEGFTYEISEDGATMTVTAPAELSAGFTQVWGGAGLAKTYTIDGVNVTEA
ncbi:MAG: hypothetical protein IJK01_01330 [Clostridia bacterium]|nr:hypothetical protein [Clostridia bacterium]